MPTTLAATRVVTPAGVLSPGEVTIDGATITSVVPTTPSDAVPDRTLVPGFVDLQVNGHVDVDVSRASGSDWDRLDDILLAQGVTTWCPTLVTSPLDTYAAPLTRIAEAAARPGRRTTIAGAHLEGPFLGGAPGAHPPSLLRDPDSDWLAALPPIVRIVTLAPERDGAVAATTLLAGRGVVVSVGHSTATYEQTVAAIDAGARMATHVFNAMAPLHHRDPGIVGAVLADDRVTAGLIADGVHVHPALFRAILRAKGPERVALVTDAVAWRAARVGRVEVSLVGGAPRLPDGTLAGSALTMDRAVANVVAVIEDLAATVEAATSTPARLLGLHDRGRLAAGARADVVALDTAGRVEAVWVAGEVAHKRG